MLIFNKAFVVVVCLLTCDYGTCLGLNLCLGGSLPSGLSLTHPLLHSAPLCSGGQEDSPLRDEPQAPRGIGFQLRSAKGDALGASTAYPTPSTLDSSHLSPPFDNCPPLLEAAVGSCHLSSQIGRLSLWAS